MGYYNPVLAYGQERFLADAASAGVDGLIIPDLAVAEAAAYCRSLKRNGLSGIFLVSPTSDDERAKLIDKTSTDLVYAVTVTGVTGAGKVFGPDTDSYLKWLKSVLHKPFVAGFGVNSVETARRMVRHADGVVIGSALVEMLRRARSGSDGIRRVARFLASVRKEI
jgi:tryptophan synthase alpha chain